LPKDTQRRKTEHFPASANDAFATIRITARDCGEQAEDVFGFKILKALSIHRAADRHIAGKAQQLFIRILGAQFRQYRAGRKETTTGRHFSLISCWSGI